MVIMTGSQQIAGSDLLYKARPPLTFHNIGDSVMSYNVVEYPHTLTLDIAATCWDQKGSGVLVLFKERKWTVLLFC